MHNERYKCSATRVGGRMKKYLKSNMGFVILTVLFGLLYSGLNVYVAIILQKVIDAAEEKKLEKFAILTGGALLYIILLTILQFLYLTLSRYLISKIIRSLRQDVFEGIFNRSYIEYTKVNSADYISALTNDIKIIEENYILPFIHLIQNTFIFLFTTYFLIKLSIVVTFSLIVCLTLMFLIPQVTGHLLQKKQIDFSKQMSIYTEKIKDLFGGYEVIKSFNIYEIIKRRFVEENNKTSKVKLAKDRAFALNESLSYLLSFLSQFAVLFVAAYLIIKGKITMGVLVALVQLSSNFVNPVSEIMNCFAEIKSVETIIKRLNKFSEILDKDNGKLSPTFEKQIELKNVSFRYGKDSDIILNNINYVFEKNKKYAILGKSGSGKSTIIKLLTGYFTEYDGYSGEILYDNDELRNIDISKIGEIISVVHQNVFLFDDSIYENICLYRNYNEEQLNKSINSSGVDLFLSSQKNGIRTLVGEGAKNISGGQKQRIGVARALITNPQILIFDEGTASLDLKTAHDIEERLLAVDMTMITITHNSDSDLLQRYDHIIRLKNGNIEKIK